MRITLDDRYFIDSDDHQWVLKRWSDPKKEGVQPTARAIGYFRRLEDAAHSARGAIRREGRGTYDIRTDNGLSALIGELLRADAIVAHATRGKV